MILSEVVRRYRARPWWDAFLALVFLSVALVLYATGLYALSTQNQLPMWMLLTQSAVLFVAQTFRRKAPVAMLAVATGILVANLTHDLTIPVMLVFVDLLFNATLSTSRRTSRMILVGAIVLVLSIAVGVGVYSGDWRRSFFTLVNVFSLLIVPVWWSYNIRQHGEIIHAERENSRQLRRIAELDRDTAIAAERAQMARDLHDVVAGHLSAIAIQSEALLSMADRDPKVVMTVLGSVRENSLQSLAEMRAMIEVLRAAGGRDDPRTAPARLAELDRLVDSARAGGLTLDVRGKVAAELPVAVDQAAYRIIQEALTNALKHSGGGAKVDVRVAGDELVIEVVNDLTGTPAVGAGTGTGLVSMRERAYAVGGDLEAGPWSGGWRVRAALPIGGAAS